MIEVASPVKAAVKGDGRNSLSLSTMVERMNGWMIAREEMHYVVLEEKVVTSHPVDSVNRSGLTMMSRNAVGHRLPRKVELRRRMILGQLPLVPRLHMQKNGQQSSGSCWRHHLPLFDDPPSMFRPLAADLSSKQLQHLQRRLRQDFESSQLQPTVIMLW